MEKKQGKFKKVYSTVYNNNNNSSGGSAAASL
jgi:hypothetical protein